ncbi:MAG: hypothetical protein LBL74_05070 [Bacteroidales bacterium]|jgi:hypothetical protein|nr:hypothetical protein [Bacteroidales bacterium]
MFNLWAFLNGNALFLNAKADFKITKSTHNLILSIKTSALCNNMLAKGCLVRIKQPFIFTKQAFIKTEESIVGLIRH